MPSKEELKIMQAESLDLKIARTQRRIREWVNHYGEDGVYVSFSGGKDSTVLLHIVRQMYPDIEAVFVNTGLEYPEIQSFVKSFDNVTVLRPKMRFDEVIRKYGYPFISKEVSQAIAQGKIALKSGKETSKLKKMKGELYDKNGKLSKYNHKVYEPLMYVDFNISDRCCDVMKKSPLHNFTKRTGKFAITAELAYESLLRKQAWLKKGCNGFDMEYPKSTPMSFWMEQDILQYIKQNNLPIASVYGDVVYGDKTEMYDTVLCESVCPLCTTGENRTGCIFCAYGQHSLKKNKRKGETNFQRLKRTHPKQYDYCMNGGAYDTDGLWKPTKEGLGMKHCIDVLNDIYGKDFIRY